MKTILVPLDPSEFSVAATRQAAGVAKFFGAKVVGLTIVDLEGIDHKLRLPFRMDLAEYPRRGEMEMVRASSEELERVAGHFKNTCDQWGVSAAVKAIRGVPAVEIVGEGRFHDLIVMGLRSHFRFITRQDDDDILRNVINHSLAPLFLVPSREPDPIRRVAVAFDGSPPATRALHRFARLAACWNPEIVLVGAMSSSEGGPLLASAQEYLALHGQQNVRAELVDTSIIEAFSDKYLDWADLCVMGGSSKSVVEKILLGSFPRKLIADGHRPLLIHP